MQQNIINNLTMSRNGDIIVRGKRVVSFRRDDLWTQLKCNRGRDKSGNRIAHYIWRAQVYGVTILEYGFPELRRKVLTFVNQSRKIV